MSFKTRLIIILLIAGMTGVFSFLLIDLNLLLSTFQAENAGDFPTITPALKFASLIQPAILMSIAVFVGVSLASRVGLSSPVAEAIAGRADWGSALRSQFLPGLTGGIVGGGAILLTASAFKPFLKPDVIERIGKLGAMLPIPTRFLYGGITEEILIRWGLMTFFVWALWRLFQRDENKPKTLYFLLAIFVSSVLFGAGHLPLAFLVSPNATAALLLFTISANSIFGLVAGYLYWKKGLESAMIAHILVHIAMLAGSYFGVYF